MKLEVIEIEIDSFQHKRGKEIRERGKIVTLIIWVFFSTLILFRSQNFTKCPGYNRETQP